MGKKFKKVNQEDLKKARMQTAIFLSVIVAVAIAISIGVAVVSARRDEQQAKQEQEAAKKVQQQAAKQADQTQSRPFQASGQQGQNGQALKEVGQVEVKPGQNQVQVNANPQQVLPQNLLNNQQNEISLAEIQTTKGTIQVVLQNKRMPTTVNNFLKLVNRGFYNGLNFHRVENWVIQGGDPKGDGTGGSGETIPLETNPQLKNVRGALAMARTNDPNSATSQFYILKSDAPWLDGQYAVFGSVLSGMDVVDKMEKGDKILSIKAAK